MRANPSLPSKFEAPPLPSLGGAVDLLEDASQKVCVSSFSLNPEGHYPIHRHGLGTPILYNLKITMSLGHST